MKNLFVIVLIFAACQKTNVGAKQKWLAQEGSDTAAWNAAMFCYRSDWKQIDTIELYYNVENPDHSYIKAGIVKFTSRVYYNTTDSQINYIREYYELLKQIQ
jgi:hypothetical protein